MPSLCSLRGHYQERIFLDLPQPLYDNSQSAAPGEGCGLPWCSEIGTEGVFSFVVAAGNFCEKFFHSPFLPNESLSKKSSRFR
jgi:hypothetical protein